MSCSRERLAIGEEIQVHFLLPHKTLSSLSQLELRIQMQSQSDSKKSSAEGFVSLDHLIHSFSPTLHPPQDSSRPPVILTTTFLNCSFQQLPLSPLASRLSPLALPSFPTRIGILSGTYLDKPTFYIPTCQPVIFVHQHRL
ncbi:uncharacterized protein UDID_17598 [Ustilago sp. UG-2017a]|nr:uncharacterized protein UDID_17598 [Ustilago sp. UG-2017a]